jgi:hypothetical protein
MYFGVKTSSISLTALASNSALIFSGTLGFCGFDGAQVHCRPGFFLGIDKIPCIVINHGNPEKADIFCLGNYAILPDLLELWRFLHFLFFPPDAPIQFL